MTSLCALQFAVVTLHGKDALGRKPFIGNKWKLLIFRNLIYNGEQRFTDFSKTIPELSKKVLSDDLRAPESDGLVEREAFAEVPPRVVYSLSELGKTLKPILEAMFDWGTSYRMNLF